MPSSTIKLSSPATHEFWEIPVLFEDAHLLALDKPAGLPASPDQNEPERTNLITLLHAAIAAGKPWAQERGLAYLMNAHRLDAEASGIILLAKFKPVLVALADFFGAGQPGQKCLALVHGTPQEDHFEVDAKLAPHPTRLGLMRVDAQNGKRACTRFEVMEKFPRNTLLRCEPLTLRPHQIRVHLCHAGLRLAGDELYGGKPLWLSRLKPDFRLKDGKTERPLISRAALHVEQWSLPHPITGETLSITAPWPKDLTVGVKYLRRYGEKAGVMQ
jgi:RluA family pseudouridine synthase